MRTSLGNHLANKEHYYRKNCVNKLNLSKQNDRTLPRLLDLQARDNGTTIFLKTDQHNISFAEADDITSRLAQGLADKGVGSGDRVALYLRNRPEMVLLSLAINKLGAIWVPVNRDYKGQWLLDTLQRCRAKLLFTDSEGLTLIQAIEAELANTTIGLIDDQQPARELINYSELLQAEPRQTDYDSLHYGDTCSILWTSGTTGKSKGVMQSHNAWIHAIVNGASLQYRSQPGDIIYNVLPLFNTAGWITAVLRALVEGITVVIEERFSASQFMERIAHFGATQAFLLGAMATFLLNQPEREDDANTPLREAQIIPLAPNLWPVFSKRFGVRLIRGGLGQSECMKVLSQVDEREDVPVYALGFPDPLTSVALFDDDGELVAPGEVGEIAVKPSQPHIIFNGYFDNPEATTAAFRGDWYLTGDVGRQDPQTGVYYYVDRKRDAIRLGGRNISTLEVESVVRQFPGIADVAAYGLPHPDVPSEQELGLAIVVSANHELDEIALCQFINDNAPYYFVPQYIRIMDALPYTPTNKIQKYLLRQNGRCDDMWNLRNSAYVVNR